MIKNFLYSLFIHLIVLCGLYFGFSKINKNIIKSEEIKVEITFANQDEEASSVKNFPSISEPNIESKDRLDSDILKKSEEEKNPAKASDSKSELPKNEEVITPKPDLKEAKKDSNSKRQDQKSEIKLIPNKKESKNKNLIADSKASKNPALKKEVTKAEVAESELLKKKDEKKVDLKMSDEKEDVDKKNKSNEANSTKKQEIKSSKKKESLELHDTKNLSWTEKKTEKTVNENEPKNLAAENSKNLAESKIISGVNEGSDLSAKEKLNIQSQIRSCYKRAIHESRFDSKLKLMIKLNINKEGFIENDFDDLVDHSRYCDPSQKDYKIAIDNVVRSLQLCNPLRNLPIDKYEIWKEVVLQFDPMLTN